MTCWHRFDRKFQQSANILILKQTISFLHHNFLQTKVKSDNLIFLLLIILHRLCMLCLHRLLILFPILKLFGLSFKHLFLLYRMLCIHALLMPPIFNFLTLIIVQCFILHLLVCLKCHKNLVRSLTQS